MLTRKYFILRALRKPLHSTGQRTAVDNLFAAVDNSCCAFNIKVEHNCILVCFFIANHIIQLACIGSDGDKANSVSKNLILYNGTVDRNPHVLDSNGGHLNKLIVLLSFWALEKRAALYTKRYLCQENSSQSIGNGCIHTN